MAGTTKKKPKKRRTRTRHVGVKIKARKSAAGTISYRAHWRDPDSGREVAVTLDPLDAGKTKESREAWAIVKARQLAATKMARAAGVRPEQTCSLDVAIAAYVDGAAPTLGASTAKNYRYVLDRLEAWADREGIAHTSQLTRARLAALRDFIVASPKRIPAKGAPRTAKRGPSRKAGATRRKPRSINRDLTVLKVVLNDWRRRELVPQLTRDDIQDALSLVAVPHEPPEYLAPSEIKALLSAALRHDANASTAIAPLVAVLLLSGMRRGEALALTWPMVDLEALDHEGHVVGEIRLPASIVKTKRARTIGLEVSPILRRILAALSLRSPGEHVFSYADGTPFTRDTLAVGKRELLGTYGAPRFTWQVLRSTCATYLVNAPGIFGSASAFMEARQLGHSVLVAEKHYYGTLRGIPREARWLETAMQAEEELSAVLASVAVARALRVAK